MNNLKIQYEYMKEEINSAISKCLNHQQWINGPEVSEIEKAISNYLHTKYCIGTSSGTEALVLSLRAISLKIKGKEFFDKEDKIITTPFTFTATGDSILRAGATPVFIDINLKTFNIDIEQLEIYLKENASKVVGMVIVHLYGLSCEMNKIMQLAKEYGLFVIEDTAQAFGGEWKNKKLGSIGTTGCFSFFPSKNLGGFGDGGMISTNDEELGNLIRKLSNHGGKNKNNAEHIGYNARLDTIQAAILKIKLKYIEEFNNYRKRLAKLYKEELETLEEFIDFQEENKNAKHVYNQFTIRIKNGKRDNLKIYLKRQNIETMIYYPLPLHKMKLFQKFGETFGELVNSEKASKEVISLPLYPLQKEDEVQFISKIVKEFFEK